AAHVPMTSLEVEPVRVDLSPLAAVREGRGSPLGYRGEQCDDALVGGNRRNRASRRGVRREMGRHAAELPQSARRVEALEPDGRRREMEGGEFVRLQLR